MAMNIRSITELKPYPNFLSTSLTADSNTQLSTALKDAIKEWEIDGGGLGSIGFEMLSCAKDSYIEVAAKDDNGTPTSYKLDLNKILDNINKTMAYVAWLQSSGITEEKARDLFVPYEGNINGKAVSGLWIAPGTDSKETALKVNGAVIFYDETGIQTVLSTTSDGCYVENLSGTNVSAKKLTGQSILGTSMSASGQLYAGQSGTDYKLSATGSVVTITDLTATRLTAGNFYAGTNGTAYRLSVNSTEAKAAEMNILNLTADNLSSATLTAVNLSAGGTASTAAYALQVSATPDSSTNNEPYYIKTKALSAEKVSTPKFQAKTLVATESLSAGQNRESGGYHVVASNSGDVKGLYATLVKTIGLDIQDLSVTGMMYAGRNNATGQWNLTANSLQCDILNCHAKKLGATEIAQLTAKAACWS